MADVKLVDLKKSYGSVDIIKGVSLDIKHGEFVVFVGPSGCGKSTLLRMISGLEEITGGDLYIAGKRVNDEQPRERGIAMVFQSYAIFPHMTVGENIGFGLTLAGVPKAEKKRAVDEAARILQMEHLLERKPSQLSGGQRQRVAIGRSIVRKPQVFLFDEPLSNLDAALRVDMRMEIGKLHKDLGRDDDLCHARPGRGDDAGRQDRGAAGGRGDAGGHAARALSQPGQPVRRGVPRLAEDELPRGRGEGGGRTGASRWPRRRWSRCRSRTPSGGSCREAGRSSGCGRSFCIPGQFADRGHVHGRVSLVERLGTETVLNVDLTAGGRIVVALDGDQPFDLGSELLVGFEPERAHLFEAA